MSDDKPPTELVPALPTAAQKDVSKRVHERIEAYLHPHQLRVLSAIRAYGDQPYEEWSHQVGIATENVQRAISLLFYMGIIELYGMGRKRRVRVVPPERRPFLTMPQVSDQ